MINYLPNFISGFFITIVWLVFFIGIWILKKSVKSNWGWIVLGMFLWLALQAVLSLGNIYSMSTQQLPPKIILFGILPIIVTVVFLMVHRKGKRFLDNLPLFPITLLHTIRIPVEMVLYALSIYQTIPTAMTFEGANYDIVAGLTAPIVAYMGVKKNIFGRKVILLWNFLALGLLLHIVLRGMLSAPGPLQMLAFDQPNRAILFYPFVWLPTFIVPIVMIGHLSAIRQLWSSPTTN